MEVIPRRFMEFLWSDKKALRESSGLGLKDHGICLIGTRTLLRVLNLLLASLTEHNFQRLIGDYDFVGSWFHVVFGSVIKAWK